MFGLPGLWQVQVVFDSPLVEHQPGDANQYRFKIGAAIQPADGVEIFEGNLEAVTFSTAPPERINLVIAGPPPIGVNGLTVPTFGIPIPFP